MSQTNHKIIIPFKINKTREEPIIIKTITNKEEAMRNLGK